MGSNDTPNIGLRRPPKGETDWGDDAASGDDLNHNFTMIDRILFPRQTSLDRELRLVSNSFSGLSVPDDAKLFGTIQDAIDDVPVGLSYPAPIGVYPGTYSENLYVNDRSFHAYCVAPYSTAASSYNYVDLSSNSSLALSSGNPCVSVNLRTGEDDDYVNGRTITEMKDLPLQNHKTRLNQRNIIFTGFSFRNRGKYWLNEAHDSETVYFMDCTDRGIPGFSNMRTKIIFDRCRFYGQTWYLYSEDGSELVSWYQHGFRASAYATEVTIQNSVVNFLNYGGGDAGANAPSVISQPFHIGTDGTSFIGWTKDVSGNLFTGIDSDYANLRSYLRFSNADVNCYEKQGSTWTYGPDSDTSCAIITLRNMGYCYLYGSRTYPYPFSSESGYGNSEDEYSNWIFKEVVEGDPNTTGAVDPYGNSSVRCYEIGFDLNASYLFPGTPVFLNRYGNYLGSAPWYNIT